MDVKWTEPALVGGRARGQFATLVTPPATGLGRERTGFWRWIDDTTFDKQLDEINAETIALTTDIDAATRALSSGDQKAQLNSAEALLGTLRKRLDKPISHELKRRIIETLVECVRADTVARS